MQPQQQATCSTRPERQRRSAPSAGEQQFACFIAHARLSVTVRPTRLRLCSAAALCLCSYSVCLSAAVQVAFLAAMHHPYIVGYREFFEQDNPAVRDRRRGGCGLRAAAKPSLTLSLISLYCLLFFFWLHSSVASFSTS